MLADHVAAPAFDEPGLLALIEGMADAELDALAFGVIGFGADSRVRRYNAFESRASGLAFDDVIGRPLFTDIAQCMNNYLVAERFESAAREAQALDDTINFVLTWRMRPTKVKLRLLSEPGCAMRYVLLQRLA